MSNTLGKLIKLFLVDGTPNGLKTAEIMGSTVHVLTAPRSKITDLIQRPECAKTGVYFLIGTHPDDTTQPMVYIGESDDVATRLKQHNKKDFWETVCLVVSKDSNLTKAHVKYLESKLIQLATQNASYVLDNGTAHQYNALPESDQAYMHGLLEQIKIVLPTLGFDFLSDNTRTTISSPLITPANDPITEFELHHRKSGTTAHLKQINGEFWMQQGSAASAEWIGDPNHSYRSVYDRLIEQGVISPLDNLGNNTRHFLKDYKFNSPSAAAAAVNGRASNGRIDWKLKGTKTSYADWQAQQLDQIQALNPAGD